MTDKEYQLLIIREFVELHAANVAEHLQDHHMLEADGSVPNNERSQQRLYEWWLDVINDAGVERDEFGLEATVEIPGYESRTGDPILFDFEYHRMMPTKKIAFFDLEDEIKKVDSMIYALKTEGGDRR
jgi:hypothetical protein